MGCCCLSLFVLPIIGLLVILKVYIKLSTGWCRSYTCLVGKTAIVTGANAGLGYETALDFAKRGARVILACRDKEKAEMAKEKIIYHTDNQNIVVKIVDFASLESVREFAADINKTEERLDILVNNAGAISFPDVKTKDGLVLGMQVNHFGPFLLTILLLGLLKKTENSRVVNVSSIGAKFFNLDINSINDYVGDLKLYSASKLCNILFTMELAKKLSKTTVTTYSLHPGGVVTEIGRNFPKYIKLIMENINHYFYKNALEGAQTQIYLSVAKDIEKFNGEHFHDCQRVAPYKSATVDGLSKDLWDYSIKAVKLTNDEMKNLS